MKRPKTSSSFLIACGPHDCEWGFPLPDLGEMAVRSYSSFSRHCVEIHGLKEDDLADSRMFLGLNKWTVTPLK